MTTPTRGPKCPGNNNTRAEAKEVLKEGQTTSLARPTPQNTDRLEAKQLLMLLETGLRNQDKRQKPRQQLPQLPGVRCILRTKRYFFSLQEHTRLFLFLLILDQERTRLFLFIFPLSQHRLFLFPMYEFCARKVFSTPRSPKWRNRQSFLFIYLNKRAREVKRARCHR